jgi:hypothetical protein
MVRRNRMLFGQQLPDRPQQTSPVLTRYCDLNCGGRSNVEIVAKAEMKMDRKD